MVCKRFLGPPFQFLGPPFRDEESLSPGRSPAGKRTARIPLFYAIADRREQTLGPPFQQECRLSRVLGETLPKAQLGLARQGVDVAISATLLTADAGDYDMEAAQPSGTDHVAEGLLAIFAELGASGAGLVLGPKIPAGKRREHRLVDVGVVDHAVDVRPERLRVVGAERELDFGVEADKAGLLDHLADPLAVTNGHAAVEVYARPGDGLDDVALHACAGQLSPPGHGLYGFRIALLHPDDDGLEFLEYCEQGQEVVWMLR